MLYNSPCKACSHSHDGVICNWQIQKAGRIKLKLVYGDSQLWGIGNALHKHTYNADQSQYAGGEYREYLDIYTPETFEYEQEVDCGCRYYVPSDNLEFLEWKYERSDKTI